MMLLAPLLLTLVASSAQSETMVAGEAAIAQAAPIVGRYRLSGARELRPSEISDDGVHTYIRWREDQDLPAVFALNPRGAEEIVDGYMRDGVFTIDRINPRLVFRIDRHFARADRSVKRK